MEDYFPHDVAFNIGELKEFSNYLNEKLDKEPIFTKDEIDNDKLNYFKGQEINDEVLENIYKANSNAKANLAREELNHIFINFEIDCLNEINNNVFSKDDNNSNKMKLDVDDKVSIKKYLESNELEKLLNDNIQKLVDEKVGLGLPVIMERYNNYSLANNGIIDEKDIKSHEITDDDIRKSFEYVESVTTKITNNDFALFKINDLIENANNRSRLSIDEYCYDEALDFLNEEIKSLESKNTNKEKYSTINLDDELHDGKFLDYFGIEVDDETLKKYTDAVAGIEANQTELYKEILYSVGDTDSFSPPKTDDYKFSEFLSEGTRAIIMEEVGYNDKFDKYIDETELYLPDLKVITNQILEKLGKEAKYDEKEIEKEYGKSDEFEKKIQEVEF